jgi:aldehyde dehydrogenase (NAD+)
MTNEIFGPVLPVLPFGGEGCLEAVKLVNAIDPQPLAAYVFTAQPAVAEQLLRGVQSGDAMVNDTFMHALSSGVPFGGVGKSGHGTYRGRLSFEAFTFPRGVVWRHGRFDIDQTVPFNCRYPPSGKVRRLQKNISLCSFF